MTPAAGVLNNRDLFLKNSSRFIGVQEELNSCVISRVTKQSL